MRCQDVMGSMLEIAGAAITKPLDGGDTADLMGSQRGEWVGVGVEEEARETGEQDGNDMEPHTPP